MPNLQKNKICCIFNLAPHYRSAIYKLMDKELNCDFYFGDQVDTPIKLMDTNELKGYKKTVKNIKIGYKSYMWQKGVVSLVFKNYKYFILTGEHNFLSSLVISFFSRLLNKKVFLWMHGIKTEQEYYWKEKLHIYSFYNMSTAFLLYGDYSRNLMIKKGFNGKKIFCIYNSLDYDTQLIIRNGLVETKIYENYFGNTYPVLIYVGRLQKIKKIEQILESMHKLKNEGVFCNLIIVGENADDINFSQQIAGFGLEQNIWLYGPCYKEEKIGELIYNADVCVSPGNVGLTAMHCFVYGTPVITHNNFENQMPEFEVIQPGINGDFFIEDNLEDLTEKVKTWINLDKLKREEVRLSAYKIIDEKYNPHYQINVLKQVLSMK
jgi:glycosyltransferase involved in cell wall biosynthesis